MIIHAVFDAHIFRDRDVARESALRKAAETRLDQLVDMYGDPSVMEELTERLPRAEKSDVKQQWEAELQELIGREQTARNERFSEKV